jgi:hypothetical protein
MVAPVRLVSFRVENVLKIKAVSYTFDEKQHALIISGDNAAGKSSVIRALVMALCGKAALSSEPLRRGATKGFVDIHLKGASLELHVEWTITPKDSYLKVTGTDNKPITNPTTTLKAIIGELSFDPRKFAAMDPKEQVAVLQEVAGISMADLDAKKEKLSQERLLLGRDLKAADGAVSLAPEYADAPKEEVSVAALSQELQAIQDKNRERDEFVNFATDAARKVADAEKNVAQAEKNIEALKASLVKAEAIMESWQKALELAKESEKNAQAKVSATPITATAPIIEKIAQAEGVNKKVSANKRKAELVAAAEKIRGKHQDAARSLERLEAERQERMLSAKFPVSGLGFDVGGVTYNAIPLQQASAAEQMRVWVGVGLAKNPMLRLMYIEDGSLLDRDSIKNLYDLAEEHDALLLIERVLQYDADGKPIVEPGAIVISDGSIKEEPAQDSLLNGEDRI